MPRLLRDTLCIKVNFNMLHNDKYKLKSTSPQAYASSVERHIVDSAEDSMLPIDEETVNLTGKSVPKTYTHL